MKHVWKGQQHGDDLARALTVLLPVLSVAVGILGGKFLYRRREAAQDTLTFAQAGVQQATEEEIRSRIEREERAAALAELRDRVADLKTDLKSAKAARGLELERVKILELQNEDLNARLKACQSKLAERKPLEDELNRLPGGGGG